MKRKMRLRWWGVGLGLFGLGVVLVAHMSYGEATVVRQFRINWYSGNVSMLWGSRSAASGEMLSLDEVWWDGWEYRWVTPRFSGGVSGGCFSFHTVLLGVAVVLMWTIQALYSAADFRKRAGCCGGCGYLLDGLSSGVCPECGVKYA
ncbi:MAG: hypothetical protein JKX70_00440 [Phycisphaerales bacterium]|nr:hypothetical protein [Phycisphaerales bacterium]